MSAGQTDSQLNALDYLAAIVCAPLGCILGLIYLVKGTPKAGKMLSLAIVVSVVLNVIGIAVLASGMFVGK